MASAEVMSTVVLNELKEPLEETAMLRAAAERLSGASMVAAGHGSSVPRLPSSPRRGEGATRP
jgi:hypothetical protein